MKHLIMAALLLAYPTVAVYSRYFGPSRTSEPSDPPGLVRVVTPEELAEAQATAGDTAAFIARLVWRQFNIMDADKNGKISFEEFGGTSDRARFHRIDADGDGAISFEEWEVFCDNPAAFSGS